MTDREELAKRLRSFISYHKRCVSPPNPSERELMVEILAHLEADALSSPMDEAGLREILAQEFRRVGLDSIAETITGRPKYPTDAASVIAMLAAMKRLVTVDDKKGTKA